MKKNQLNRLKFWKNRPVWFGFGFISLKPKKQTESNPNRKKAEPNRKKTSQTKKIEPKREKNEPNRFEPVFILKN
jgi:hypothetical protein